MNYSVCMDAVYQGKDFVQGMREVARSGINAFEFWSWWDKDIDQICVEKEKLDLRVAAMCTRFASLVDLTAQDAYLQGLEESIVVAKKLGCKTLISQTGADTGAPREQQRKILCEGLKRAASQLEAAGITLVIEPLNLKVDHAGYFLSSSDEAFDIIKEVDSARVKVLFDLYHQQITEGDVLRRIQQNLSLIGHFHAAGNPGRHELDTGELHYPNIFREVVSLGFTGYMGLEYFPLQAPLSGLQQLLRWTSEK